MNSKEKYFQTGLKRFLSLLKQLVVRVLTRLLRLSTSNGNEYFKRLTEMDSSDLKG